MAAEIRFYRDQHGGPAFDGPREWSAFGSLLTSDVQGVPGVCLDLLAWLQDVREGRRPAQSWEGNSWSGEIRPDGVHLVDLFSDDWSGDYPLTEAHDVAHAYLIFLRPDDAARESSIAEWEQLRGRPHPCRSHI